MEISTPHPPPVEHEINIKIGGIQARSIASWLSAALAFKDLQHRPINSEIEQLRDAFLEIGDRD